MKNSFYVLWILCVLAGCGMEGERGEAVEEKREARNEMVAPETQNPKPETQNIPYYRFLTGRIGDDLDIAMNLQVLNDSLITGFYWYQNVGRPIELTLQEINKQTGKMKLSEKDPDMPFDETISGFFIADFFEQGMIEGRWTNGDGTVNLSFLLNDAKPGGNAGILLKEFEYTPKNCPSPEDCLSLQLMEMEVTGVPGDIAEKINQELAKDYIRFIYTNQDQKLPGSLVEAVDSLEKWVANEKAETGDDYFQNWSFHATPEIIFNQSDILSFRINYWSYTGGAHGNPFTLCYNYDLKTGKKLKLPDFYQGNASPNRLKAEALRRIKLTYEGAPNDNLTDLGFLVSDKEFELSEDFYYCPAGINFVYSPYEMGPYAMGFVEVFVPFKALN